MFESIYTKLDMREHDTYINYLNETVEYYDSNIGVHRNELNSQLDTNNDISCIWVESQEKVNGF